MTEHREIIQIMPPGPWHEFYWTKRDDGSVYAEAWPLVGWALTKVWWDKRDYPGGDYETEVIPLSANAEGMVEDPTANNNFLCIEPHSDVTHEDVLSFLVDVKSFREG